MKELVCIICPRGCCLKVDDKGCVSGNFCPRGAAYAISELTHPKRTVTSTVKVKSIINPVCPVKTKEAVDKDKIFDVMKAINLIEVSAPIKIGDVIRENIAGTGVALLATANIDK